MLDASYQLTIYKQPELLAKGHTHCVTVGCHSARATFDVVLEAQLVRARGAVHVITSAWAALIDMCVMVGIRFQC